MSTPPGPYRLFAECVGNPDFQQYAAVGPDLRVEVADFQQAARLFRKWVELNHLGGGNVGPTQLVDDHGKIVAYISYNGRIWSTGKWVEHAVPLYEPTAEDYAWALAEALKEEDRMLVDMKATEQKTGNRRSKKEKKR